jgi:predicted Fe-Mo cluster-binding NifX family protein
MTEKANLKNKLIKAYTAAGDTREQAIKKIDKW